MIRRAGDPAFSPPPGSNPVIITNGPGRSVSDIRRSFGPGGKQIAFVSNRDGNNEIYIMNIDGSDPKNLTNHPASDQRPAFPMPRLDLPFAPPQGPIAPIAPAP